MIDIYLLHFLIHKGGNDLRSESKERQNEDSYIEEVKRFVKEIQYGSVTLVIQDRKVIQIDRTEKIRQKN